MTAIDLGVTTGRSARTYYNTGNRASPTWNEISYVAGSESFDTGKEATITGENRLSGRKISEDGVQDPCSLKFAYQQQRGVSDADFAALLASKAPGGTRPEFAVMDGNITLGGATGFRFFGKVTELSWKRDLDKFAEWDVAIEERVVYEAGNLAGMISYTVP